MEKLFPEFSWHPPSLAGFSLWQLSQHPPIPSPLSDFFQCLSSLSYSPEFIFSLTIPTAIAITNDLLIHRHYNHYCNYYYCAFNLKAILYKEKLMPLSGDERAADNLLIKRHEGSSTTSGIKGWIFHLVLMGGGGLQK